MYHKIILNFKTQSQKIIKSQTPKNNRKNTTKMTNTMKVP